MSTHIILEKVESHQAMVSPLIGRFRCYIPVAMTLTVPIPRKTYPMGWSTRAGQTEFGTTRAVVSESSDRREVVVVTHGIPCWVPWSNSQPTRKPPLWATSRLASRRCSRVACPLNRALSGSALTHNHCFTVNTHLIIWKR